MELSRAESVEDLCRRAVELARHKLGIGRTSVWLLEDRPDWALGTYGIGESGELRDERGARVRLAPDSAMGRIALGLESVLWEAGVPLLDHRAEPIGRGLSVKAALRDGNTVVGCLCADDLLSEYPWTRFEVELIKLYAEVIGSLCLRLRAQEALRESEDLLRRSQEAARIGSYAQDVGRGTWASSPVLDEIFGIAPDATKSVALWAQLLHPDDRAAMVAYLAEAQGRGTRFDRTYRIVRQSDGAARWVHGIGDMSRDADGNVVQMAGTIRDITDEVQASEEQAQLRERLAQAQRMESVGRLAGGIAHDFNSMLSVIIGRAGLAQSRVEPDSPVAHDLAEIARAAERSASLTRQLLAFARKQTIAPRALGLNEAVSGMLSMLRRLIGEHVALVWEPDDSAGTVHIDPSQLDQIVTNLVTNARDSLNGAGTIAISTGTASASGDAYAVLTVRDDGCGMDAETLASVFEPFFTTKAVGEGTGLGLATIHGIVEQNGGSIEVASEPGEGTTFRVRLPRSAEEAPGPAPEAGATAPERGHETILLVEDEPMLLELARTVLERQGYAVVTAPGPAEALHVAAEADRAFDLLITDVVMPQMNGRDLADALERTRPGLRCLFMSGYTADIVAHHGVLESGVQFIQKPFSGRALAAKVREVLDEPA